MANRIRDHIISWQDREGAKANNQITLSGASPKFPDPLLPGGSESPFVFFLQQVIASGTFDIKDNQGTTLFSALPASTTFPAEGLRFDGGCQLIGTITLAIGYYVRVSKLDNN